MERITELIIKALIAEKDATLAEKDATLAENDATLAATLAEIAALIALYEKKEDQTCITSSPPIFNPWPISTPSSVRSSSSNLSRNLKITWVKTMPGDRCVPPTCNCCASMAQATRRSAAGNDSRHHARRRFSQERTFLGKTDQVRL
jgi:hypothetical protein